MREILKLGGKLLLIAVVAGLALGVTNEITQGPIEQQSIAAANAARQSVLPAAADFALVSEDTDGIDEIYRGLDAAGAVVGYTGKITVTGYGGPIEVTVGVDAALSVSGISVGGANFAETASLGAKTKDAAFAAQFAGLDAADQSGLAVRQDGGDVDAVSSATISSRAVSNGVGTVCKALVPLLEGGN